MNNTTRGVKQRILLMALLPGILISLIMGSLYLWTRFSELEHQLLEKAQSNSARLSTFIDFALSDGDLEQVQQLATLALEDWDVHAISLIDDKGNKIIHAGPKIHLPENALPFPTVQTLVPGDQSLLITSPLYRIERNNSRIIAWLQVEYSYSATRLLKYRSLIFSTLLVLLGLGLGALFCLRLGRAILSPLDHITNGLNTIASGKTDHRLDTNPASLLHDLESSINTMLDGVEQASDDMRKSVDQTTVELQETLETIEVQNVELDLARKEALEASRSKSEFLANMSHEIRTPLNGITGYTTLMLESDLKPQQRDYLTTIEKSAQGLMFMLNDILDFSRLEAGKLELDNSRLNLHAVIDNVLSIMAPAAHHKSLELVRFIYNDTPTDIMGDRQRLTQILTNLVNNAVKFTNSGSVAVRVMPEHQDNNGLLTLKFTVTDTGTGLTPEQHSKLFKAFSQADSSRSRKAGGTGLGLAISKSLVEQMDGEIGLDSDLGRGSSFWFTIRTHAVKSNNNLRSKHSTQRQVLLYEPQELSRLAITQQLERLNCTVTPLHRHQDILKCLQRSPFDLILTAQEEQPLKSVLATSSELTGYAPVIVLTTTHSMEAYPDALPLGVTTLSKPVDQQRLSEALQTPDPDQHRETQTSGSIQPLHKQQRILVVDDNPVNIKLLKAMLENMGHKITTAASGFEAIKQCRSTMFDLVLMDVQMPGMDGIEATRQIRGMEHIGAALPIIAVTAHALPDEKKLILQSGINDYMTKPVNSRQLSNMVNHWTNDATSARSTIENPADQHRIHRKSLKITKRNPVITDNEPDPVDRERSIQLAGGNKELADETLEMLVQGLEDDLTVIHHHVNNGHHQGLLERVHRLHGACRYCGVPELEACCHQLESQLKQNNGDDLSAIQSDITALIEAIHQLQVWHSKHIKHSGTRQY